MKPVTSSSAPPISQSRSRPLEKNFPSPVVTSATGPSTASTSSRAACRARIGVPVEAVLAVAHVQHPHVAPLLELDHRCPLHLVVGGIVAVGSTVSAWLTTDLPSPTSPSSSTTWSTSTRSADSTPSPTSTPTPSRRVLEENGRFVSEVIAPAQPHRRHPGQPAPARQHGQDARRVHRRLPGLRRGRLGRGAVRARVRRRRVPVAGRAS